jgi:hypothetical protein
VVQDIFRRRTGRCIGCIATPALVRGSELGADAAQLGKTFGPTSAAPPESATGSRIHVDAAIYPDHQGAMRWWIGAGWTDQIMGQTAVAQELKKKRGVLKWLPLALLLVAASCGALIEAGSEDTAPTPASMSSDTSTDTDPEPSGPPTY